MRVDARGRGRRSCGTAVQRSNLPAAPLNVFVRACVGVVGSNNSGESLERRQRRQDRYILRRKGLFAAVEVSA
jgi:hypothetical protein